VTVIPFRSISPPSIGVHGEPVHTVEHPFRLLGRHEVREQAHLELLHDGQSRGTVVTLEGNAVRGKLSAANRTPISTRELHAGLRRRILPVTLRMWSSR
jgi:hypothetical protein